MKAKKLLCALCTLTLVLSLFAPGGLVTNAAAATGETDSLKVLSIGNSYSADSLNYLAQIAEAYDKKVDVGFLVQASGSLSDHVSNINSGAGAYIWYTYIDGVWNKATGQTLLHGLTAMDWDVIALQQRSLTSGAATS